MGLPLTPRGLHWVAPVSLERFIPSIIEASKHCGNPLWDYTMDQSVGFMPVVNAQVITEIEPLILLTGVTDVHVGSCGVESLVQKGLLCWPLRGSMMLFWLLLS